MSNSNSSGGSGTGAGNPRRVRIDEALSGWPTPERSTLEWDESAEGVMARLGGPARDADVSDEALLAPPLAAEPGEVQGSAPVAREPARAEASMNTTSSSRQRDRASLQELAKMANETPAPPAAGRVSRPSYPGVATTAATGSGTSEAKDPTPPPQPVAEREENSGIINLAALAAEEKPAESAPISAAGRASAVATASSATTPSRAKAGTAAAPKTGRASILYVFGTLATAAAVAAGVFIGMRRPASEMSAPVAAVPAPVQATPAPVATTQPGVAVAATDKAVDPSTLPEAIAAGGAQTAPSTPAAQKPLAAATPAPAAPSTAAPDPKLVAVVPTATAAPAGSGKSLEALMQQAAGVTSSPTAPAATSTPDDSTQAAPGSVPLRPSTGAVRGALGAVTPGAKACLEADDPISHAMVTFQSDGSVQNVTVSGGAAGKPAEACIRAALSRARIPAFASATFSAPVTIRPN
jgi:hypothetical protein